MLRSVVASSPALRRSMSRPLLLSARPSSSSTTRRASSALQPLRRLGGRHPRIFYSVNDVVFARPLSTLPGGGRFELPSSSSTSSSTLRCRRRQHSVGGGGFVGGPRVRIFHYRQRQHHQQRRTFSSSDGSTTPQPIKSVRIHFGSQGGTAQLFAMQLGDELDELADDDDDDTGSAVGEAETTVSALNDPPGSPHERLFVGDDGVNVIITSVTGVGDPPDNCREFYEWLNSQQQRPPSSTQEGGVEWDKVRYAVFGCGNSVAHPNNYNVIGKGIDAKLNELGARRIHELGLGDDSDCIEDDFDNWQDGLIRRLTAGVAAADLHDEDTAESSSAAAAAAASGKTPLAVPKVESCWHTEDADEEESDEQDTERKRSKSDGSSKYPRLKLARYDDGRYDLPRDDLFHLQREPQEQRNPQEGPSSSSGGGGGGVGGFYRPGTRPLRVLSNRALATGGAEYVMRELRLNLEEFPEMKYEAGDHLLVYPRNAQCVVDSYLGVLEGVRGSDLIEGIDDEEEGGSHTQQQQKSARAYPHPFDVTVEETLMHCVDLSQPPSPSFARFILGRKDVRYKDEIAATRMTPIELIRESGRGLSLEELLYNLPPMQPRYYSIASSPTVHPRQIFLTFRPVKYLTALGHLREGLCTSFMKQLHPVSVSGTLDSRIEDTVVQPVIPAAVNPNPTFRLPRDDSTPIVLIAGGCGVAPIRSFLEERMEKYYEARNDRRPSRLGPAHVFLGFRSPRDEVYRSVVDAALNHGIITSANITYTKSCRRSDKSCTLVTQVIAEEENSRTVYDLIANRGGHIYLCGGARVFGAAVETVLLGIFGKYGDMDGEEANEYLRGLIREGRLQEDLAD